MKTGLAEKVVMVTGGASGIGRASCLAFGREGAKVVVADVDVEGGEETASIVRNSGGDAIFVRADISNASEAEMVVATALARYGRLDCAHNNAGIPGPLARTADYREEDWDKVVTINLKGIWLCMKYEIARMLPQHAGAIVNTASTAGLRGSRGAPAYAACSHGVIGLTRSAALEYIAEGIRINAVCPGIVDTPMIQRQIAGDDVKERQFNSASPIGRMATPDEIAQTVIWLCSDAAAYVVGQAIVADGGRTAQ